MIAIKYDNVRYDNRPGFWLLSHGDDTCEKYNLKL